MKAAREISRPAGSPDAQEVWKRHLGKEYGPFEILWGHGSSPMIYKNTLILLCDHQGQAYLLSLDKKTGKQIWKVERGKDRRSYTTPFIIPGPQGDELIVKTPASASTCSIPLLASRSGMSARRTAS